jgi:hypothetical protein
MKFASRTRVLLVACFLSAPLLGGADGTCHKWPPQGGGDGGPPLDAGAPTPCAPQDAQAEGPCFVHFGFKWDGNACVSLGGCTCKGADCRALYPDLTTCERAHAHCGEAKDCSSVREAMFGFVNANKTCNDVADCQTQYVGCGVTEDDCTGAVYVNKSTDLERFESLRSRVSACGNGTTPGCSMCLRVSSSPACIDGQCKRRDPECTSERQTMIDFINANKACSSTADCQMRMVGCGVTDGDCTGAVYVNRSTNLTRFGTLARNLATCATGRSVPNCGGCTLPIQAPECIAGQCTRHPN